MIANRLIAVALTLFASSAGADTTIDPAPASSHTHAANTGWARWNWGTTARGATVTPYLLAGKIYHANIGWIDLGDGNPDDGLRYSNTGTDFGVNHDGAGNLTGMAYSANTGWITFAGGGANPPSLDLTTGRLHGYAYATNTGWVDLGTNAVAGAVTTGLATTDSDGDRIDDTWEREQTGGLTAIGASPGADADRDGATDAEEFAADTDPLDPSSVFAPELDLDALTLSFPTSPRRLYQLFSSTDLTALTLELPAIKPTSDVTTISLTPGARGNFFQLRPVLPLAGEP